mmetsp:Transcript_893/g.2534  ORF Transcript_893/g.2534 Transcript_893/m.2534 type:complete len:668 (-) Transcript_893:110-2113(-)
MSNYREPHEGRMRRRKGNVGLANLGNTCYMNSALQCLAAIHPLQKHFRHCAAEYQTRKGTAPQRLVIAFCDWFKIAWGKQAASSVYSPEDILRQVQVLNPNFAGFAQQDSQELLRLVLDVMHEEIKTEVPQEVPAYLTKHFPVSGSGGAQSSSSPVENSEEEDPADKKRWSSVISEIFEGRQVSMVRCLQCQKISRTYESFFDLSVPIPVGSERSDEAPGKGKPPWGVGNIMNKVRGMFFDRGVDLTDCLRPYCATELLTGKDKYLCEHCKAKVDGEKTIHLFELPEVLTVHLKRFRFDGGWFGSKNSRTVTFPMELCMKPYLDAESKEQNTEYQLAGIIQHIGSLGGGHYIAYCRHKSGDWLEFDDARVSVMDNIDQVEPYVLFYQRVASGTARSDRQMVKADLRRVELELDREGHEVNISSLSCGPVAFIPRRWYVRLTASSCPGPLDNFAFLCPHGRVGPQESSAAREHFVPVSVSLFERVLSKYGGGPVITSLESCKECQAYMHAYNERKAVEKTLVQKYDTKDTGDGNSWYLVDAIWVAAWKSYVQSKTAITLRDLRPPGPINNDRLLSGKPLRAPRDYIGVNARVWCLLHHCHGGGPLLCRSELSIASATCEAESDLRPPELSPQMSWQFVDECRGDWPMYASKYLPDKDEALCKAQTEVY